MLTQLTLWRNVSAVNIKETTMNFAIAAFGVVMLDATPALSAGFEQIMVPDPAGAPLEVGVWYPSNTPAAPQPLGLFEQTVANRGPVAGRTLPLIAMSHGTGGSFEGHYDTALALAEWSLP
jgi:predicted dienelactone hydrolase